jgi:hypothetical protein
MDPSEVNIPHLKNLTIDNITDNVKTINSNCPDPRLKYILERLVQHLHDFARETRLSHNEWMTGLLFLTSVGQICTDVRQVRLIHQTQWIFFDLLTILSGIHLTVRHPRSFIAGR